MTTRGRNLPASTRARRRFGQHFLEPAWVAKLVAAVNPAPSDRILEIGPGRGALTIPLAARVERLLAVEIDRDLAAALAERELPGVRVVTADVLSVDVDALVCEHLTASPSGGDGARPRVRIVGNLPYYITSPILFRLVEASRHGRLSDATLMVQHEVAERLAAAPSTPEYGSLTIGVALFADVEIVLNLPSGAFRPPPKVRSAVVRLTFRPPPSGIQRPAVVSEVVRSVFTQRRKTLANALTSLADARGLTARDVLARAGIDAVRRAETLSLQEFGRLADALADASVDRPAG
jgi:16S rRNA (adenine1518-N6/adenine1519-N6)-dimethyltransferase